MQANQNLIVELVELVELFCKENGFEPPRKQHYSGNIKHLKESDDASKDVIKKSKWFQPQEESRPYLKIACAIINRENRELVAKTQADDPRPWIGVDFDGTLAHYDGWKGEDHLGEPIPAMVERVKRWLAEGKRVKIFTARVAPQGQSHSTLEAIRNNIKGWCIQHIGQALEVTHEKDCLMIDLWDDRVTGVVTNEGITQTQWLENKLKKANEEIERLCVQLAACGAAALDCNQYPLLKGDYAWSPSYQDVRDLRLKTDRMRKALEEIVENPLASNHVSIAAFGLGRGAGPELKKTSLEGDNQESPAFRPGRMSNWEVNPDTSPS